MGRALTLAEAHDGVWVAVGVHPHQVEQATDAVLQELEATAKHPRVVALGETGLDVYRAWSPRAAQEEAFRQQIRRALAVVRRPASSGVRARAWARAAATRGT